MSTTPNSIPEHIAYEEQRERRRQAMARHGRQQPELFEHDHEYPECPTCGEHGRPVYGRSYDPDTGYDAEEIGCALCMPRGCETAAILVSLLAGSRSPPAAPLT